MSTSASASDRAILMAAFARLDPVALAVAFGTIFGLILFMATAVLLIRGGEVVGPHLALLGVYLPGYEVTWPGSLIGAAYFWLIGAVLGLIIAVLWNMTHYMYVALMVVRTMWWRMMAD
jgi:hypothetical protein